MTPLTSPPHVATRLSDLAQTGVQLKRAATDHNHVIHHPLTDELAEEQRFLMSERRCESLRASFRDELARLTGEPADWIEEMLSC